MNEHLSTTEVISMSNPLTAAIHFASVSRMRLEVYGESPDVSGLRVKIAEATEFLSSATLGILDLVTRDPGTQFNKKWDMLKATEAVLREAS
jgi:hypothetical protein